MELINMVAKSYESLELIGEPYEINKRWYIKVRQKNNTEKQVRWYSEKEYSKLYPKSEPEVVYHKTQKEVLGFAEDYITIFKGGLEEENDYFRFSPARYTRLWGWYFVSGEPLPNDLPPEVTPIKLRWSVVGNADGKLKTDAEVQAAVESLIYPTSGQFIGEINDKVEVTVTILKNVLVDTGYGHKTFHVMEDAQHNQMLWTTSARSWPEGSTHHITAKVKCHNIYRGIRQTVLNYCKEV